MTNIAPFFSQMMRLFNFKLPGTGITVMMLMVFMAGMSIMFRLVRGLVAPQSSQAVSKVVRGKK